MAVLDDVQGALSNASQAAATQVQKSLQNTTLGNLGNAVLDVVNPLPQGQRVVDAQYSSTTTLVYVGVVVLLFYYWRRR